MPEFSGSGRYEKSAFIDLIGPETHYALLVTGFGKEIKYSYYDPQTTRYVTFQDNPDPAIGSAEKQANDRRNALGKDSGVKEEISIHFATQDILAPNPNVGDGRGPVLPYHLEHRLMAMATLPRRYGLQDPSRGSKIDLGDFAYAAFGAAYGPFTAGGIQFPQMSKEAFHEEIMKRGSPLRDVDNWIGRIVGAKFVAGKIGPNGRPYTNLAEFYPLAPQLASYLRERYGEIPASVVRIGKDDFRRLNPKLTTESEIAKIVAAGGSKYPVIPGINPPPAYVPQSPAVPYGAPPAAAPPQAVPYGAPPAAVPPQAVPYGAPPAAAPPQAVPYGAPPAAAPPQAVPYGAPPAAAPPQAGYPPMPAVPGGVPPQAAPPQAAPPADPFRPLGEGEPLGGDGPFWGNNSPGI